MFVGARDVSVESVLSSTIYVLLCSRPVFDASNFELVGEPQTLPFLGKYYGS